MREDGVHQLFLRRLEFIATTKPWISSVTSAPTMWAPMSLPVLASKIVLTRPSGSPSAIGLAVADEGEAADLELVRPVSLALASVRPTRGDLRVQ
jgi:hypothetical protein